MLSQEEKILIEHEVKKFPFRQAAAIEALLAIQKERKYINNNILEEIAEFLQMSYSDLDSIATFYNLIYRKPVGQNMIRICDSVSCYITGYKKILLEISNNLNINLGETSKDNNFTLLPAQCLGACDKAPVMMINNNIYYNLTKEKILDILKSYQDKREDI